MSTFRCEECGERFGSKMNFDYHKDLVECSSDTETGSNSSTASPGGTVSEKRLVHVQILS